MDIQTQNWGNITIWNVPAICMTMLSAFLSWIIIRYTILDNCIVKYGFTTLLCSFNLLWSAYNAWRHADANLTALFGRRGVQPNITINDSIKQSCGETFPCQLWCWIFKSMIFIELSFDDCQRNFRSRRWGSSLTGLRTLDPPLGPPSTLAESFWRTCLRGGG